MQSTQAIVVYTPVQDALYNGGMLIPLMGAGAAGLLVFVVLMKMFERKMNQSRNGKAADWIMGGSALAAVVVAGLVFHKLMI